VSVIDVALCQMAVSEGRLEENRERVFRILEAHGPAHDLLIMPETCLSGFSRREEVEQSAEPLDGPTVRALCAACARLDTSLVLGIAERAPEGLYNTALLIGPDGLVGSYRKTHLWVGDRGKFLAGDTLRVLPWKGLCVGLLICFDIEFPEPARALARMGAELILVANSNMHPYGPVHVRAACARAQENQVFVAMANRTGPGRDDLFVGESIVVAPSGEPLLRLDQREAVASIRIDPALVAASRAGLLYLEGRRDVLGAPQAMPDGSREVRLSPEGPASARAAGWWA
jgi:(R)-amidase